MSEKRALSQEQTTTIVQRKCRTAPRHRHESHKGGIKYISNAALPLGNRVAEMENNNDSKTIIILFLTMNYPITHQNHIDTNKEKSHDPCKSLHCLGLGRLIGEIKIQ